MGGFYGLPVEPASGTRGRELADSGRVRPEPASLGGSMSEDQNNGAEFEDDDEQIEQMIIENGILLHSLATLLVKKGILSQEEIDAEMDRLYDQMENFEQQ
jgi:hypothetical protein